MVRRATVIIVNFMTKSFVLFHSFCSALTNIIFKKNLSKYMDYFDKKYISKPHFP